MQQGCHHFCTLQDAIAIAAIRANLQPTKWCSNCGHPQRSSTNILSSHFAILKKQQRLLLLSWAIFPLLTQAGQWVSQVQSSQSSTWRGVQASLSAQEETFRAPMLAPASA